MASLLLIVAERASEVAVGDPRDMPFDAADSVAESIGGMHAHRHQDSESNSGYGEHRPDGVEQSSRETSRRREHEPGFRATARRSNSSHRVGRLGNANGAEAIILRRRSCEQPDERGVEVWLVRLSEGGKDCLLLPDDEVISCELMQGGEHRR